MEFFWNDFRYWDLCPFLPHFLASVMEIMQLAKLFVLDEKLLARMVAKNRGFLSMELSMQCFLQISSRI